ncbi:LL-diaminopimelate aminotransferase [Hippea maritima]|uniref:Aminotransferase n=1 Tax=Hippea maritima (strain ATCC 700847 / DSM 10411 / MH2) TaxID=760142 RepID=F2LWA8_HIPMA|nr:LL-diaminopimelate aminotransferase [Hippea maritima]AEA34042.1 LL-diaminopimelate aminotransferase [Hippea maritima DSM 10411]
MTELADRIKQLPPYLFAEIDRLKEEVAKKGVDIIDLGVGDPDIPTPNEIVEVAKKAIENPKNHQYPSYVGMLKFRESVANWYKRRFGVELDPSTEVVSLIGSKEGIAHLPLAYINPSDYALVPDPGYPVYPVAVMFAGGEVYKMPLKEENGFLIDLDSIDKDVLKKAKLMFLGYPNNPTSAVADKDFYKRVVELAKEYGFVVASDNAYSEICYDGYKPISFLEVEGAKDVGIEFHSLSKTFNMTGWRIGFAVGNRDVIAALGKVKTNIDSGIFQAIQEAGAYALDNAERLNAQIIKTFQKRRDQMDEALRKAGFEFNTPKATFYFWVKVPKGFSSAEFTKKLLQEKGIVVTPGNGFGDAGEGYFRISITNPRIEEAVERIRSAAL